MSNLSNNNKFNGVKILEFKKIDSTQKKAMEIAKKEPIPWTVILAKEQTQGVGRKGEFWYSPKGGIYFSIILPKSDIKDLEILNFLAAFLIGKIIKENFNLEPLIKLPNDVYLGGKKIAGILTQNVFEGKEIKCSVMGIGINTNIENFPEGLKDYATSLEIELGKKVENEKILKEFLEELKEKFKEISQ